MGTRLPVALLSALATGCIHHQIAFDPNPSWHYTIDGPALAGPIVVALPSATRSAEQEISSAMTGLANRWHAEYGRMFLQALEVELSQFFASHEMATQCDADSKRCLELDVSSYSFHDFAAHTTVTAKLRDASGQLALDKSYSAVGRSGTGKAVGLGAFGMKSAVRQSTLDAYRQVLSRLRTDLRSALAEQPAVGSESAGE